MRNSLHKVVEELVEDLENGEHVDGYWLRDTCELNGWKVVSAKKYEEMERKINHVTSIYGPKNKVNIYEAFEIMHTCDGTFNKSDSISEL